MCDTIAVIIDRLIKAVKFRPIKESIIIKELAYKVNNTLFAEHSPLEELIINYNKLFTSKYWDIFIVTLGIN